MVGKAVSPWQLASVTERSVEITQIDGTSVQKYEEREGI